MSLEQYAIHIAPRGGPVDLKVDEIIAGRQAAQNKRLEYARSKGAMGLYQNESSVGGLIFGIAALDLIPLPAGWAIQSNGADDSAVAVPKAADRSKEQRALVKALKDELAALPRLPGAAEFTHAIGGSQAIIAGSGGRSFALASCWFERIGETTFVMTPWISKREETGNLDEPSGAVNEVKTAFHPEGCERVGLSVYYAAKERVEAAEKGAATS